MTNILCNGFDTGINVHHQIIVISQRLDAFEILLSLQKIWQPIQIAKLFPIKLHEDYEFYIFQNI